MASMMVNQFEFIHSFTIHAAVMISASKRMSDPNIHICIIIDIVSYKDEAFVMKKYLNNHEEWGRREE